MGLCQILFHLLSISLQVLGVDFLVLGYSIVVENGTKLIQSLIPLVVIIIQYILYCLLSLKEVIQRLRLSNEKVTFFLFLQGLRHSIIDVEHLRFLRIVYDYVHFFVLELLEKPSATFTRVYRFGLDKAVWGAHIHVLLSIVIQF